MGSYDSIGPWEEEEAGVDSVEGPWKGGRGGGGDLESPRNSEFSPIACRMLLGSAAVRCSASLAVAVMLFTGDPEQEGV